MSIYKDCEDLFEPVVFYPNLPWCRRPGFQTYEPKQVYIRTEYMLGQSRLTSKKNVQKIKFVEKNYGYTYEMNTMKQMLKK